MNLTLIGDHTANTYTGSGVGLYDVPRAGIEATTPNAVVVNDGAGLLTTVASLGPSRGGTGSTATPSNGQVLVGNGTSYTPANITGSAQIGVTNGPGTIGLAINASSIGSGLLTSTGVAAGAYTSANISVDAAGRITAASNGSGGSSGARIEVFSQQITIDSNTEVTIAFMPWQASSWTGTTTRTFYFWYQSTATVSTTVRVRNNGGSPIGSTVIAANAPFGIYSFTITNPGADTRLDFTAQITAGPAPYPSIYGVIFEAT